MTAAEQLADLDDIACARAGYRSEELPGSLGAPHMLVGDVAKSELWAKRRTTSQPCFVSCGAWDHAGLSSSLHGHLH